ncbi:MAG: cobalt-zinc-cadmium resistance protein CzcA [Burkholderiales bacterium]|jgi:HAE1 family hydrophobic/amphiphilic exporter-1|nr:cobalt-zinc-cadmium resistance protein CzcA [Burkholderiales bacterium]
MWLTKISLKNPYFATVIMLALLLLGLISIKNISVEEFPDVKFPVVVVTTNYKGASPEVIETDISRPIEETLNSLNGIKTIRSYSFEGQSVVVAEFSLSVDPEQALQDSRDKVSAVSANFRKEIDNPTITKVNIRDNPIMSLAVASNEMPLKDVTDWINRVAKKRLQTVAGVGDVKLVGAVNRQVRVNVEPYKLQSMGLSVNDVVNAIKNANDNFAAGDVRTKNSSINVRLNGKLQTTAQFADIVITYRNSVPIKISDIGTVEDGQEQYNSLTLVNGKRAIGLDIRPAEKANTVDVSDGVYAMITQLNQIKPANISISVVYDQTDATRRSLSSVDHTLFEGAILTILIVFIFLKSWRSTVITGLTLPIALIGTIFAIYVLGFTLNMMSLMALSLSVGLLIDDAIVVRENIVRHLHMGKDHYSAALDGTNEIGLAVLSTTMTVVAVFLPVGFMKGIIGKFFFQFGITVTVAVLISLLVSFILDPMLSSIWHEPLDGGWLGRSTLGRLLNKFEQGFNRLIAFYEKFIHLSLNYKKITLSVAFGLLIGSFFLVPFIGAEFIPKSDNGKFDVRFKTAVGSNVDYTATKVQQVDDILRKAIPEIKNITAGINKNFGDGTNNASLTIDIGSKLSRFRNIDQIMEQSRKLVNQVGGIDVQNIMPIGGPGGDQKPINVEISGDNTEVLKNISDNLLQKIQKIKGITDLETTYQQANPAFAVNVDREVASNLGISLSDVGNALSVLFAGNKVSQWEDTKNGQNYDVMVQIPEEYRNRDALNLLKVVSNKLDSNNLPQMVPLSVIASTKSGLSPRELDHINLQRTVTITGNVDGSDNQAVFSKIQTLLNQYKLPTGYSIVQSGSKQDMDESFLYAVGALLIGIVFIYMILTAQFRSFILPLVIMVALPLSFVGVFLALLLFKSTLNMFSIIGIIMLMGLAAKNGILLVDFINEEMRRGVPKVDAIVNAGVIRLRPIMMTTCAMIFGMLPVALSSGVGSETRKPMAYAIIGGMTTSTLLTLIVVPVIYYYLESFSKYIRSKF